MDKLYDILIVGEELVGQLVELKLDILAVSAMAVVRLGAMAHQTIVMDILSVGDAPQDIATARMNLKRSSQGNNVVEYAEQYGENFYHHFSKVAIKKEIRRF